MDGARALDRLGKLFKLGGEDLKLCSECLGIGLASCRGRVDERLQHHCDAGENGFLNPVESFFEPGLLLVSVHVARVNEMG